MNHPATAAEAVAALERGEAVIFPTDTVYGVGVSVRHAESPEKLYQLKQRDARKPVAWLVGSAGDLARFGEDVPALASALARAFWPGPLTLIVRASESVPRAFCSAAGTVGLRMPDSATALGLLRLVGAPLATTSANPSGAPAPRCFADVDAAFAAQVGCVVVDDAPRSGVASTILDCTGDHPLLVREGGITVADMRAVG
ncbi:L-threonylcarbamoyladenylate synthase [Adlercreutzia sp. ZJ473]|uniref:L-threonylcarbamoyladenylate synthase n=1 Tax=Adlercreutzia sp. ZJ473 TaxID=2722822 RepID=UPI0015522C34